MNARVPTVSLHQPCRAPRPARSIYVGKPCSRGHDGRRYVVSRNCVTCSREQALAAYVRSREAQELKNFADDCTSATA
jgi:hypothetical protein